MNTTKNRKWVLCFRRSILGWLLVSARPEHGRTLKGTEIPKHVLNFAEADERGFVRGKEAGKVINDLIKKGAYQGKTIQVINDPPGSQDEPPHLDWDACDTEYTGSEDDGVYYGAVEKGGKWWAMATVDSDTGHFTDSLLAQPGFKDRASAFQTAKNAAEEWCAANNVNKNMDYDEVG